MEYWNSSLFTCKTAAITSCIPIPTHHFNLPLSPFETCTPARGFFIKTCNNTDCVFSVHSCLSAMKREYSDGIRKKNLWVEEDIFCSRQLLTSKHIPYHGAIYPPVHSANPPREANREAWHYFKSNFTSTKASAAVRKRARWILFINKVIHKWWELSRVCVCVSEVQVGWGVKDGGERRPLCLYPLTPGWAADGCWEDFAPVEVGGQRDWALAWGATEPVSVAVWSRLIKAGAAAGSVALSRGIGLGEKSQSHSSLGGFPVWLGDWGIRCCCCCCWIGTNAWFSASVHHFLSLLL